MTTGRGRVRGTHTDPLLPRPPPLAADAAGAAEGPGRQAAFGCQAGWAGESGGSQIVIRILDRYIGRQILSSTGVGVLVLSGVLVLGNLFRRLDELLGDANPPIEIIIKFAGLVLPFSLIFTIPWGLLSAILLVFGRMSADNELVSMRMAGISMTRLCAPVFLLAIVFSGACLYFNVALAPVAKDSMKRMFYDVVLDDPVALFQPGRTINALPGYRIHVGERDGNEFRNLRIVVIEGRSAKHSIYAREATFDPSGGRDELIFELRDLVFQELTSGSDARAITYRSASQQLFIPLDSLRAATERVNESMKTNAVLHEELRSQRDSISGAELDRVKLSEIRTELHKRYSFSLACFTFALVGIPLGITAQRRETSTGFVLSLAVACLYFVFVIVADNMRAKPEAMPHLLMWLPNAVFLLVGSVLFWRLSRR